MSEISLDVEWLSADDVATPEFAATWCRLQIGVDEQPVTLVEDERTRETRTAIYCSAYPLAEWIATSWWLLRSSPERSRSPRVRESSQLDVHDARSAGDGFVWPRLRVVPAGHMTHVTWAADRRPRGYLRFLASGEAWLTSSAVQFGLARFVDRVLDRLTARGVTGTLLQDEWAAVRSAGSDEAALCDAAAALGLDPYDIDLAQVSMIEAARAALGRDLTIELASASTPASLSEDVRWATSSIQKLGSSSAPKAMGLGDLASTLRSTMGTGRERPWEVGYRQADVVRDALQVGRDSPVDLSRLVSLVAHVPGRNPALQGVAGTTSTSIQLVPARKLTKDWERFLGARAIHSALGHPAHPTLIRGTHDYDTQVERAFAAELLAPGDGIDQLLAERGPYVSQREVKRLARHFDASPDVIRHQLQNHLGMETAYASVY